MSIGTVFSNTLVGKQIGVMRVGCAKDLNDTGQCGLWPCAHFQRLGGHSDGIDADQRNSSKCHWAQAGAATAGQRNLTDRSPRWDFNVNAVDGDSSCGYRLSDGQLDEGGHRLVGRLRQAGRSRLGQFTQPAGL